MQNTIRNPLHRALAVSLLGACLYVPSAAAIDLLRSYELALMNDGQLKVAKARADQRARGVAAGDRPALSQRVVRLRLRPFRAGPEPRQRLDADAVLRVHVEQPDAAPADLPLEPVLAVRGSEVEGPGRRSAARPRLPGAGRAPRDHLLRGAVRPRRPRPHPARRRRSYEAQLRAAKLALRAGSGTRTDIDDIQARYDLLLADEIKARQAIGATTEQLEIFVGEPIRSLATLDPALFRAEAHDPIALKDWVDRAHRDQPGSSGAEGALRGHALRDRGRQGRPLSDGRPGAAAQREHRRQHQHVSPHRKQDQLRRHAAQRPDLRGRVRELDGPPGHGRLRRSAPGLRVRA